ncbi:2-polyprenyl-6-methoxyphenol hydroxylase-like FAD-dependent oxidoreductase [Chryseobacterium bernardetii]|uniref:2-polyprenyl-6-methoxyphenol hydroxylase-like FAD-dependent oxidoreductase n=2 Tax=Chryseobacterium TaxID=59732 RepID=A0A543E4V1_9FLAO|nr:MULTISPECIES: FAD-dependent monooxygenase [Chryseobacterium]MDR6372911.1 2-polyprenyl-6-methoxyphenol hydroxylase-like FAD-dependent oxidoreductase [Chryseobacterium vietnamense]MDR6443129.1 2-polyprenyl-6-methoxyphenol hydroxylase-like FAD-dependent oxidoreductase [Chryseobacterium bernardetii]TQM16620.1 2-polyprenyl-6-methoxyphenol hydroxylase-like FAD-dependent oxidoreductase [Chryseobacterium aquifrigidense]
MKKIAVVGAGISGLSMANYLEKHKIDYHIYERRNKKDLAGHGFLIPKEGMDYLYQIIDPDILLQHGNFLRKYTQYSHTGKILAEKELDHVFAISRHSLINLLAQNISPEKITYEETIIPDELQNGKLKLSDGTDINADITIISDGSRSRIRRNLFKDETMRMVRESEVVNIIQNKEIAEVIDNDFMKFHHKEGGLTFGILKLSDDTILWYSQFDNQKYMINECSAENLKKYMLEVFENWHPLVPEIIQKSNYKNVHLWNVYELEELNPFYKDNFVFIGDAAHPLIPFTSQGVTSALKDSFSLTKYLVEEENIQKAFNKYETDRKPEIEHHIRNGRTLLKQFLLPLHQQPENILPISYK